MIRKDTIEAMKDLIMIIAKGLVEDHNAITVTEHPGREPDVTVYELHVAPEEMGKVIGKQGNIAKAIRTVVKAAAIRDNRRVVVEIV